MKHSDGKRGQTLLLVVLLAALCVGGTELAAAYLFNRPLYHRITEPVIETAHAAQATALNAARGLADAASSYGTRTAEQLSSFADTCAASLADTWERLTTPPVPEDLPDRQEAGDPALLSDQPITDPSVTELEIRDGQEVLTGGIVPVVYFNQGEEPWASQFYGSDPIRGYGCGPVAMAMAISSMTEYDLNPVEMSQWAVQNGHWAKSSGSRYSLVQGAAAAYGLTAEPISEFTVEAMTDALLSNSMLVALMGPGHFTKSGHFILLRGTTLSGSVLVADPNSEERSLMEWDPQLILDELSSTRANGAPLWVLSDGGLSA